MFFSQFPGSPDTGTVYADHPRKTVEDATGESQVSSDRSLMMLYTAEIREIQAESSVTNPARRCNRTSPCLITYLVKIETLFLFL